MIEKIDVLAHSAIRIRQESGSIYVDPFHVGETSHDGSFIFITHDHYDHFSPEDIRKVCRKDSVLIVPEKMKEKAETLSGEVGRILTVHPGKSYEIDGFAFETIAAYNTLKPFHPKSAEWVGYILIVEGMRIYIAGDTDITKENQQVNCHIALVPVGGTYTMDAKKAAKLINTIRPDIAVPTHYGDIVGKKEDAQVFAKHVDPGIRVEIRMV